MKGGGGINRVVPALKAGAKIGNPTGVEGTQAASTAVSPDQHLWAPEEWRVQLRCVVWCGWVFPGSQATELQPGIYRYHDCGCSDV